MNKQYRSLLTPRPEAQQVRAQESWQPGRSSSALRQEDARASLADALGYAAETAAAAGIPEDNVHDIVQTAFQQAGRQ